MPKIEVPEELAPQIKEQIALFKSQAADRSRLTEVETELEALTQERAILRKSLGLDEAPAPSRGRGRSRSASPSSNGGSRKRIPVEELEASVIAFLKANPDGSANGDIASAIDVKKETLSPHLSRMFKEGKIKRTGELAGTRYFPKV